MRLLFIRSSNSTQVFSSILKDNETLIPIEIEMFHKSHHDSCWRTDSLNDIFKILQI